MHPSRVHITGPQGSGKSTLARRLGALLEVPIYDLDWIAYTETGARPERDDDVRSLASSQAWITEGTYDGWTDPLLDAADLIVWLDVPWRTCAWRMVKRHIAAELRRSNMHPGMLRLARFIRYCRGYHDLRHARPGQTTRHSIAEQLSQHEQKVVRLGAKNVDDFFSSLTPSTRSCTD